MMSNEKRIVLFFILMFLWLMLGYPYFARLTGIERAVRKRPAPPKVAAEKVAEKPKTGQIDAGPVPAGAPEGPKAAQAALSQPSPAKEGARAAAGAAGKQPGVELVDESKLVLGSVTDKTPGGYRLRVQLEQKGAGIESVSSSRYDAEYEEGLPLKRPLQFIRRDPSSPPSLAVTLSPGDDAVPAADAPPGALESEQKVSKQAVGEAEDTLDSVLWDVIPDEQGRIVRHISGTHRSTNAMVVGEEIVFRTKAASGVVVTKTFRLWQDTDGLELELKLESPDKERSVVTNLLGPHGIPVEGEWYTSTYRDLVFGRVSGGTTDIVTSSAYEVATATKPIENTERPLRFAGVENQYFATLVEPDPPPTGAADRWDNKTSAVVLHTDPNALQKADIAARISSKPIKLGPGTSVVHTYRVFAGPKIASALNAYGAGGLASYRKNQWIPFASDLARYVITPTLGFTYEVTARVARLFGFQQGNYGVAIILLTVLVRGMMFPLGRKQALAAQKMQELQPLLKEIQEKYKEDKEKLTQETFGLYKKHGVNPVSGCLPALIQLPIFVGLWQALNTSVPLRHASFLWIRDLAAPDMLFRFPVEVYFLGKWFNLLPFVVVGLMLFQTKLFSPPATTPEAEMQQKTMKYMMIFMGVMFYKVPSGLGIYFITSSLWAIAERLLLPKVTHAKSVAPGGAGREVEAARAVGRGGLNGDVEGPRGRKGGSGTDGPKGKLAAKVSQFWDRVLDEARKDATYRKMVEEREARERDDKGHDKGKDKPRAKPRKR
jgi:YidC/Oxa1 family membrane protein insertase